MVFPGVLRGRPGPRLATKPTNRPRRSLSSPWILQIQSSRERRSDRGRAATDARSAAAQLGFAEVGSRERRKKRRGPKPSEEPVPSGPRAFLPGWRGLTPRWPRSLRLGSASGLKVARARSMCNPLLGQIPHIPRKMREPPTGSPAATGGRPRPPASSVRQRLSALPQ